jgi:hypothetical protein
MRAKHTIEAHKEDLQSVIDHLPGCYVECVRILSAYNEVIATAIRNGAPLVTYAIERRCIGNYMDATTEQKK